MNYRTLYLTKLDDVHFGTQILKRPLFLTLRIQTTYIYVLYIPVEFR